MDRPTKMMTAAGLALALAVLPSGEACAAARVFAQLAPLQPLAPAVPATPTYGVQPYNPSNPRGFYHPNDMGYGSYQNPTRLYGHRPKTFSDRRYRGY